MLGRWGGKRGCTGAVKREEEARERKGKVVCLVPEVEVEGEYKLSIDSQIWRGPDEVIRSNPGVSVYYTCATHVLLTLDLVKVYEAAFLERAAGCRSDS